MEESEKFQAFKDRAARGKHYQEAHYQENKGKAKEFAESLGLNNPKGLSRIILPELTRPFIAHLSVAAGKAAKKYLQKPSK